MWGTMRKSACLAVILALMAAGQAVAETPDDSRLSPKCAELEDSYRYENHTACWQEMQSQPGCYAWNGHYHSDRVADWTGACPGGVASGRGTQSLTAGSNHDGVITTGSFAEGIKQGRWVLRFTNEAVAEGPYVDGKLNGRWVIRYPSGNVHEGPFVDDMREGQWVIRFPFGDVHEGPFVHGHRHGKWDSRYPDGSRLEQEWRNGSREGQPGVYVTKGGSRHSGRWSDGCFVDDEGDALAKASDKTWEKCHPTSKNQEREDR